MISTKKELIECLKKEKSNYGLSIFWRMLSFLGVSENSLIWLYQMYLRKWEYHLNSRHRIRTLFYKYKTTKIGFKYNIQISPNSIDSGLHICHLGNVVINGKARIGRNFLVHQNVYIIATNGIDTAPVIGDNCKIGVGAIIIGDIIIGNNVVIGAGAVVTKNFIEDKITIGGVPAKIISHKAII